MMQTLAEALLATPGPVLPAAEHSPLFTSAARSRAGAARAVEGFTSPPILPRSARSDDRPPTLQFVFSPT